MARPKEAILSKSLIRDQALAIIDEDGLDGLTMRRLATRLGVQAASLYTHFANKDAVLDSIGERLARRIDPTGFAAGWQEGLRTWAGSYYEAVHWHPNAAAVLASGKRTRADQLALVDDVHRELVTHGWPGPQATMVAAAVKFVVVGAAATASGEGGPDDADRASFRLALDSLLLGLETTYAALPPPRRA